MQAVRQLRRGVHRSTKELKAAINDFIQHHNREPKPFIWHKTADQILDVDGIEVDVNQALSF